MPEDDGQLPLPALEAFHTGDSERTHHLPGLAETISRSRFSIAQHIGEIFHWWWEGRPQPHLSVFRDAYKYFGSVEAKGVKPNVEQYLAARFSRAHHVYETAIRKADLTR